MTEMKPRLIQHTNTHLKVEMDCADTPKATLTYEAVLWTDPNDRESFFELKEKISKMLDMEVAKWAGFISEKKEAMK